MSDLKIPDESTIRQFQLFAQNDMKAAIKARMTYHQIDETLLTMLYSLANELGNLTEQVNQLKNESTTGDIDQAALDHGFSLRHALKDDLTWICDYATHIHYVT